MTRCDRNHIPSCHADSNQAVLALYKIAIGTLQLTLLQMLSNFGSAQSCTAGGLGSSVPYKRPPPSRHITMDQQCICK